MAVSLLDAIRTAQNQQLIASGYKAVVQRPTSSQNAHGEETDIYVAIGTYSCKVQQPSQNNAQERLIGSRESQTIQWVVVLPWDADVQRTDRISVTDPFGNPTGIYEVIGSMSDRSDRQTLAVQCDKVS